MLTATLGLGVTQIWQSLHRLLELRVSAWLDSFTKTTNNSTDDS